MSGFNCCFLTCIQVLQEAGKVVWYFHPFIFCTVCCDPHKGFSIVSEAEVGVFLEFSCFFYDPVDVGNLISGSSAFSKSSLNIWKFSVHVLLKPGFENFEHYLLAGEMSTVVRFEHSLALPFFGIGVRTDLF